ncbi:DUF721 domain-containing protein [Streptomyces smyrnaeus]|uniref:DUF721 domain-containing protein n=1 Tax=Streptomyces smyrnaeus TaxID=1387713 RepID=A0ABS3Y4Z2_9ACTN|nr:DciA family protein [Streptomyces smyrnaeus]MBO8202727.1 DUF721 domain-containing protein [Streptomyces smyrnaeus]
MTPVMSIRDVLLTLEQRLFGHVIASPAGRVRARWQQVVGPEIAIRVRVAGFDEQMSTLVVEGGGQAWVTQMRLLGPRLVQRLQEDGLPVSAVASTGPAARRHRPGPRRPESRPQTQRAVACNSTSGWPSRH